MYLAEINAIQISKRFTHVDDLTGNESVRINEALLYAKSTILFTFYRHKQVYIYNVQCIKSINFKYYTYHPSAVLPV